MINRKMIDFSRLMKESIGNKQLWIQHSKRCNLPQRYQTSYIRSHMLQLFYNTNINGNQMKKIAMVSIILPTYNESENIIELILEIDKQVKGKKEIIIVDDNSPDGTSKTVKNFILKSKNPSIKLVTRKKDRGLTNSIREGIAAAKGDVVAWLDCDFSMPPSVIPKLLGKIEEGYDIAKGTRYTAGGGVKWVKESPDPLMGVYLSKFLNIFAQRLFDDTITDYTTGFICTRKNVFDKVLMQGDYGEYAPQFFVHSKRQGFTIAEVPFIAPPRKKGESKTGQDLWQYIKRGRKYIWTVGKLVLKR